MRESSTGNNEIKKAPDRKTIDMPVNEKKLEVKNLRISFRTVSGKLQAVRGISFDLYKGKTIAIVGESGSGKSVTSKAILGISAGNAIVEGGEILYDGQDLLKIKEEDFYKLRGDKIAMIFQDPLSSLNPIMRIGKQLTEAMILKGKARQRSCRSSFRMRIKLLEKYMIDAQPDQAEKIREQCALFRKFEMQHIKMEQSYNAALESAQACIEEIENALYLIEKKAFINANVTVREIRAFAKNAVNPYVVSEDAARVQQTADSLGTDLRRQIKTGDYAVLSDKLASLKGMLEQAVNKAKPDFMALGYYTVAGNGINGTMNGNDPYYKQYLDDHFLRDFEALTEEGIRHSDEKFNLKRETAVKELDDALYLLTGGIDPDDEDREDEIAKALEKAFATKDIDQMTVKLCAAVDASVDPMDIVKDSAACVFSDSLRYELKTYRKGLKSNDRKKARYDRQMARYNRKLARGKKLDYTVPEPQIVNLPLTRLNYAQCIDNLSEHYKAKLIAEKNDDKAKKAVSVIDSLKQSASGMVLKITKHAAKNKAIKLMEEVGIPEPRKRYRQYPFEFSGGMRQRIVIAIALAANPDILICDEPTTALDVTIQAQILELINKLKKERNLSIIFITHDLGVVANMADYIAVMYAGRIVEFGTAEEVFYDPKHPYTWALLSSMPDLDTKEKLEAIPGTPPNMIYPPKGDAFADRNRYAMQIDFERQPPEFPVSDTHWAATWLLHPDAPKVEPPKMVMERIAKMKAKVEEQSHV